MPTFAYQARDKAGQRVSGTREATDQRAALEALREIGLYVTQLAPVGRAFRPKAPAMPSASAPLEQPSPLERPQSAAAQESVNPREVSSMSENRSHEAARESVRQERTGPGQRMAPGTHRSARAGDAPEPALTQPWARANAKEMALFFSSDELHAQCRHWLVPGSQHHGELRREPCFAARLSGNECPDCARPTLE